jgi:hypothetical protein
LITIGEHCALDIVLDGPKLSESRREVDRKWVSIWVELAQINSRSHCNSRGAPEAQQHMHSDPGEKEWVKL